MDYSVQINGRPADVLVAQVDDRYKAAPHNFGDTYSFIQFDFSGSAEIRIHAIFDERDRKLEAARERRAEERQRTRSKQTRSRADAVENSRVEQPENQSMESLLAAL